MATSRRGGVSSSLAREFPLHHQHESDSSTRPCSPGRRASSPPRPAGAG